MRKPYKYSLFISCERHKENIPNEILSEIIKDKYGVYLSGSMILMRSSKNMTYNNIRKYQNALDDYLDLFIAMMNRDIKRLAYDDYGFNLKRSQLALDIHNMFYPHGMDEEIFINMDHLIILYAIDDDTDVVRFHPNLSGLYGKHLIDISGIDQQIAKSIIMLKYHKSSDDCSLLEYSLHKYIEFLYLIADVALYVNAGKVNNEKYDYEYFRAMMKDIIRSEEYIRLEYHDKLLSKIINEDKLFDLQSMLTAMRMEYKKDRKCEESNERVFCNNDSGRVNSFFYELGTRNVH